MNLAVPLKSELGSSYGWTIYDANNDVVAMYLTEWNAATIVEAMNGHQALVNAYEIDRYEHTRTENFLRSIGYRPCDIAACNCGSWHKDPAQLSPNCSVK